MALTDLKIQALPLPGKGESPPYPDDGRDGVPGLWVRVNSRGQKTFVLTARFGAGSNPTKAPLGAYPTMGLAEARAKARAWREAIRAGRDPRVEEKQAKAAASASAADKDKDRERLFENVAADFRRLVLVGQGRDGKDLDPPLQRTGPTTAREIEDHFTSKFRGRLVETITRADVEDIITELVEAGKPGRAHNMLAHVRKLFNWAIGRSKYQLDRSPCDRLKPKILIGEKRHRDVTLTPDEIRFLWTASERLGYPYRDLIRLLLLTGLRLNEVARLERSEYDVSEGVLRIPAARMKNKQPFVCALSSDAREILDGLPATTGRYLFSTTVGARPVSGFSKAKIQLDTLMLKQMREGHPDPHSVALKAWTFHDLRRTLRTNLSALRVAEDVRELVLAHGKSGLKRTYDQHDFVDEKREALEAWAGRVRAIVNPTPSNVLPMRLGKTA